MTTKDDLKKRAEKIKRRVEHLQELRQELASLVDYAEKIKAIKEDERR